LALNKSKHFLLS